MPYKDREVRKRQGRERWHNRTPEQKERRREYEARHRLAIKIEVLTHYGNGIPACVTCGEARLACLSIDHINNNGAEERRGMAKYGFSIYRCLKSQGFPKGYQTLCMNCQFIKAHEYRGFH